MSVMSTEPFAPGEFQVTEPGVVTIPNAVYHSDPVIGGSLSATGMKRLLPPSCPAKFKWLLDNPEPPKDTFDFGHAAHRMVLSEGEVLDVLDFPDYKTKAAREAKEAARAAGKVPLLAHQLVTVEAMAQAIREHPIAGSLFRPGTGAAEQSLFWRDKDTKQWCRARLDWLPTATADKRLVVADYKTTADGEPYYALPKTVGRYSYQLQAAHYLDGVKTLGLAKNPDFVFVFQEKEPPYVVTVVELDMTALQIGRILRERAIAKYRECLEADHWPPHSEEVVLLALPPYILDEYLEVVI